LSQNLPAEIVYCHERARQAQEKADRAATDELRADFLAVANGWLVLAHSYEHQHRLSQTVLEFERRRNTGALARVLQEQGSVFDPDDIAKLAIAYHGVLKRLGLADRENGATLLIAKRIIHFASQGERDTDSLTAATLKALFK
jgi:hypothetical protein